MSGFRTLTSTSVVLRETNIDTDQIIPARFLSTTERAGLGKHAFNDWRWQADGSPNPGFAFNQPHNAGRSILLAGRNFGCGSSREHAPWALEDYGFKAIVAPSFADIFASNCTKIGLLTIALSEDDVRALMAADEATVDLEAQEISWDGGVASFEIDPETKHRLLNGLDDIALTLAQEDAIAAYERERERSGPITTAL
jgi:3-isopropylmalate/(R)-2-methylmalate dehydratase small subunit